MYPDRNKGELCIHYKMAASSSISLTEELFNTMQLNKYKETVEAIMPGSGLPGSMFEGSIHTANYELDTRLTYKVNKWKQGKTTKTRKVINPNVMFTAFGVFCDKSPGAIRKHLCEWINDNLELFKRQCFMGMACKDIDFDDWFTNMKRNDTVCDEFGLSGLCQAFQRHALVVTSNKIWTTIPASHSKTNDEIRRLCDIHFLFMCRDTYSYLTPKFEWKRLFPIGEIELVQDQAGPLGTITEKVLDKESNEGNKIKEEPTTGEGEMAAQHTIPPITPNIPVVVDNFPHATQNLLVPLPPGTELDFTDATLNVQTGEQPDPAVETEPSTVQIEQRQTIPCSISLNDISVQLVDGRMVIPSSHVPLEPNVMLERRDFNLRDRPEGSTVGLKRPPRMAKRSINYKIVELTSEEELLSDSDRMNKPAKSAPSGYRLATHRYMIAKRKGLIQGPTTRTKALKIDNNKKDNSADSDATIEYIDEPKPPKRKRRSRSGSIERTKRRGTLVTKRYYLRRDGKGTSQHTRRKPKWKHRFKCVKCESYCSSVKALNAHFKLKHRKLQCKTCQKFFPTPGSLTLHLYVHLDGQFECKHCKKTFPFKSQLEQHLPSHSDTRAFICLEPKCDKSFSHEHDLKKHAKSHSGEVHYCQRCDYSNPDERLLNQHMNSHLRIKKYFCKNCKAGFIHSNQLKHHYDKGCD